MYIYEMVNQAYKTLGDYFKTELRTSRMGGKSC